MSDTKPARALLEQDLAGTLKWENHNPSDLGSDCIMVLAALAICDAIDRNTAALEQSRPAGWSAPRPVPGGTLSAEQMAAVVAESNGTAVPGGPGERR